MKKTMNDIEALEQKIQALKEREDGLRGHKPETENQKAMRIGLRIGVELLSAVVVGGAIGYLLDDLFASRPWIMIIMLFFGGAAGILNVYRLAKQEDTSK